MNGYDLYISMDSNIQQYCEQAAEKAYIKKQADEVSVIVMNPQNGELMAMVNYPEFNLNEPFTLIGSGWDGVCGQKTGTAEPHVEKPVYQRHL